MTFRKTRVFGLTGLMVTFGLLQACQVGQSVGNGISNPSQSPIVVPSGEPLPTAAPTVTPSAEPTVSPTTAPTAVPTASPTSTASVPPTSPTPAPPTQNLFQTLQSRPEFSTLVQQLSRAEFKSVLDVLNNTTTRYTLFAPNNDAFAKLSDFDRTSLLNDTERLRRALLYHVVAGDLPSTEVVKINSIETLLNDNSIFVSTDSQSRVKINDATLIGTVDLVTTNGYIHGIDTLLMPGTFTAPSPSASVSPSPSATPSP